MSAGRQVCVQSTGPQTLTEVAMQTTRPAPRLWPDFFALRAKIRVPDDFLSDRPLNETRRARDPFAASDARRK